MLSNHRKQRMPFLLALCGISTMAGALHAEVIFDNFDYDGEYLYGGLSYAVQANSEFGDPDFSFGQTFVVSGGDYTLDNLVAPILYTGYEGTVNFGLTLSIYTNGGDGLPDVLLESATFSDLPEDSFAEQIVDFGFSGTTVLEDGTRYWITATVPGDEVTAFSWYWNADDTLEAPYAVSENGGPWNSGVNDESWLPQAAFRVEGTLVPAPGVLAGIALGLITTRRRRESV